MVRADEVRVSNHEAPKTEIWLAGALQLIGGRDLAQEILHRMAKLLGLARQIA